MSERTKRISERAWIRQVLARYEELERLRPVKYLPEAPPDWVCKVMSPLVGVSHPKLNRNPQRKWTSRDLGYFLGRQAALERVIWGEVPLGKTVEQDAKEFSAAHEKIVTLSKEEQAGLTVGMRSVARAFQGFPG